MKCARFWPALVTKNWLTEPLFRPLCSDVSRPPKSVKLKQTSASFQISSETKFRQKQNFVNFDRKGIWTPFVSNETSSHFVRYEL